LQAHGGEVIAGGAAAAEHKDLRVPSMVGDQLSATRGHLAAVAKDVADEVPGDPVVYADVLVLAASVAEPALRDSPQACPAGQRAAGDPGSRHAERPSLSLLRIRSTVVTWRESRKMPSMPRQSAMSSACRGVPAIPCSPTMRSAISAPVEACSTGGVKAEAKGSVAGVSGRHPASTASNSRWVI
jgi:hypothetical protein